MVIFLNLKLIIHNRFQKLSQQRITSPILVYKIMKINKIYINT